MSNEQSSHTSEFIRKNIVKIVDEKGCFYGTAFFININTKRYGITCHHCIYKLNKIMIEKHSKKYLMKWNEKYSDMGKDIAVLEIDDNCPVKPLNYSQAMPKLHVILWGFSTEKLDEFPEGIPGQEGNLSGDSFPYSWKKEPVITKAFSKNKWNEKPKITVNVFQFCGKFELGFSGAPVCYDGDKKVIGMFTAKDNDHGYVIPIQTILEKFEADEVAQVLKDEKVIEWSKKFMDGVKEKMDICFDHNTPHFVVTGDSYKKGYKKIREQRAKIRAITEIREDNLSDCKTLKDMVDELRHLDGVEGGMAVGEDQYMTATTSLLQHDLLSTRTIESQMSEAVYSERPEVVRHNQCIFNTLWKNATPADKRFSELEEKKRKSN